MKQSLTNQSKIEFKLQILSPLIINQVFFNSLTMARREKKLTLNLLL